MEMKNDRKRIRVACNACRRKKIRCDGLSPCQNCVQVKEEACAYELRPASMTVRSRVLSKTVDGLKKRVKRLEAIVAVLGSRLGMESFDEVDSVKNESVLEFETCGEDSEDSDTRKDWTPDSSRPAEATAVFFGAHSLLGILLESSMQWMEKNLGPDQERILHPLRNMPVIFQMKARRLLLHWLDPAPVDAREKARMLISPFPKNKAAVMHLIRNYYTPVCLAESHNPDEMLSMFDTYYCHKTPSKPVFRVSTLLKMLVAFLQAISNRVEAWAKDTLTESKAGEFSAHELSALQNQLLNYLVAYHQRLSIIGEGVESVEALLLLVQFIDKELIAGEISYLILALAVRLAHALGFHRIETYASLSPKDATHRRYLWSLCRFLDMQTCFRTGRNPIINYSDISPEIEPFVFGGDCAYPQMAALTRYFEAIFQCRFNSYLRLFSASAQLSTFTQLRTNLDFLNQEMATSVMHLPPEMRPVFYTDPQFSLFSRVDSLETELSLSCLLTYFSHMMLINRLPLISTFADSSVADKEPYKQLSLNSARTILHLVMAIDGSSFTSAFRSWALFFPMSAMLHLLATCMSFPTSAEAISDLRLLIDAVVKIFNQPEPPKSVVAFEYGDMCSLILVLVKTVLCVTVTILENKTGVSIIGEDSSLRDILYPTQKRFPELYDSVDSFRKTLKSHFVVLTAKSPFADDSLSSKSNTSSARSTSSVHSTSPQFPANEGGVVPLLASEIDFGLLLAGAQMENIWNLNDVSGSGTEYDPGQPNQFSQFYFG